MAAVNVNTEALPAQYYEQLAGNLTNLLPHLSGLTDFLPKETTLWKLKLLKDGATFANSRLRSIKAEVLLLASGKDTMLPSKDEAWRLSNSLQNCKAKYFKGNGHTILMLHQIFILLFSEIVGMLANFSAVV